MAGRGPRPGDWIAGLSVGLVLVPQSLAYAVLAGVPPERGLLVAVVATIAAAPFASSPWLQTGPVAITALLTLGALEGLAPVGSDEYVKLAILLALLVGAIRLAIGLVGEGGIAHLLSRPVLAGFTPAAALVIAASQVPTVLGVDVEGSTLVRAARALGSVSDADPLALGLAVGTAVAIVLARRLPPRLPVVVLVVVAGILVRRIAGADLDVVGTIPPISFLPETSLPWGAVPGLLGTAIVIAVVGFGEAAAIARTYAAETRTRWDANREFISQGVANLASAAVGGFPAGGSFSRSALGRVAGAETTWAGAITGLTVLLFLPFVQLLADLPKAVLAGIIIGSVLRLVRPTELLALRALSRPQFMIAGVTAVVTLVAAPRIQWALIIGIALSIGWHLRRETLIHVDEWVEEHTLHLRPSGVLYFGSAPLLDDNFLSLLAEHPDASDLVVHCDRLGRVDVTGALVLRDLIEEAERAGLRAELRSLVPAGEKIVTRVMAHHVAEPRIAGVRPGSPMDRDD